jgi:hypothetical protein
MLPVMIQLNDAQLKLVMAARACASCEAHTVPGTCLRHLQMRGRGHFSDDDVASVTALALTGLAHQPAA